MLAYSKLRAPDGAAPTTGQKNYAVFGSISEPTGLQEQTTTRTSSSPKKRCLAFPPDLGVQPLDLEPNNEPLEPGEIMLFVDDFVPTHLKYAG